MDSVVERCKMCGCGIPEKELAREYNKLVPENVICPLEVKITDGRQPKNGNEWPVIETKRILCLSCRDLIIKGVQCVFASTPSRLESYVADNEDLLPPPRVRQTEFNRSDS